MAKKKKDIPMPMQLGSVKKQPAGIKIVCRILKYLFLALIVGDRFKFCVNVKN